MLDFLKEDIVVLPFHDSFIVPAGFQMAVEASMKHHFNLLTGSDISVETEEAQKLARECVEKEYKGC
jgi:hypothetical protein